MKIFILGTGVTGGTLARLLHRRGHRVVCADRNLDRCRAFASTHIPCIQCNARKTDSLIRAARGCDLLVQAAPAVLNESALRAAARLKVDYLDMASHLARSPHRAEQFLFAKAFERAGTLALINAGAAPGLTNVLASLCAESFDCVDQVRIRLFEDTESGRPISTWSADVAFDEAVSPPLVYRHGCFRSVRRFSGAEKFRFPSPIGEVRVVHLAQDEVATLPIYLPMNTLDVKAGGGDIERLRTWFRRGSLRGDRAMSEQRFPETPKPEQVQELMRRRILRNAWFAVAVAVTGRSRGRWLERRWSCIFPNLRQLQRHRGGSTPIAHATAECAAAFIRHWPRRTSGVLPPEALPAKTRRQIIADLTRKGFRFHRSVRPVEPPPSDAMPKKRRMSARSSKAR